VSKAVGGYFVERHYEIIDSVRSHPRLRRVGGDVPSDSWEVTVTEGQARHAVGRVGLGVSTRFGEDIVPAKVELACDEPCSFTTGWVRRASSVTWYAKDEVS
jgi:hypothetical protein